MVQRLLMVVNSGAFFLSHRLALAQAAEKSGYAVHIAVPPSSHDAIIQAYNFYLHPIYLQPTTCNPIDELRTLYSVWRLYRQLHPDIVHHITIKPILYGGLIARYLKVPLVVHTFTGLGWLYMDESLGATLLRKILSPFYKWIFRYPQTRVIFQNETDRRQLLRSNMLIKKMTYLVPGSGVCMQTFYPTEEIPGEPKIIFPGRLLNNKGLQEFIWAAKQLKAEGVIGRFIIVGPMILNHPASIALDIFQQWVAQGTVEYWGRQMDMPRIMQSAHIICLPSYREGLSRTLIEAAASARAIVTTDVPGCADLVSHGLNGLLVPVKNSQALAAALKILIESPRCRQEMGRQGRKRVENLYHLDGIIESTLKLYQKN